MKYTVKPWSHQLNALKVAEDSNELALFFDMGTGKTATAINILRLKFNQNKKIFKTIIFAPLVVCENWKREFEMHAPKLAANVLVLNKSGQKRLKDFDKYVGDSTIIVTNYESLRTEDFFKRLEDWGPKAMVLDESHLCKNHKSKQAKKVEKLSRATRFRYLLTGTPILNSALDIFHQFLILDGGETFGKNYYVFQLKYFKDGNSKWAGRPGYFPKWEPVTSLYPELNNKIYSKALRVVKSECLDLPPLIRQKIEVELSPEQKKIYKDMERDFVAFLESKKGERKAVLAELAITKALRLQQIVTGFVTTEDGEVIEQKANPRLDVLKELLESITKEHKVIVWCSFIHNYRQVEGACKQLKLSCVKLTGEQTSTQKQESMDTFNNDPKMKVMIANRRAGGIGVNLIAASYSIIYSRNFSLGEELQSEARNYRGGSEIHESVTKIDLVAPDTIDARVVESLGKKEKTSEAILGWFE
jgi:SNF2 family DNA or RNA helicase